MTTKAGAWIDHKQAIVVLITDANHIQAKKVRGVTVDRRRIGSLHHTD